jgi:hypothetical protein
MMGNQSSDNPKRPWPLIWAGVIIGLLVAVTVAGLAAMYIANFNLLEWLE